VSQEITPLLLIIQQKDNDNADYDNQDGFYPFVPMTGFFDGIHTYSFNSKSNLGKRIFL
tara:strand:- start:1269 stop:1445 length:177 start_codon:yes stop_codon:yes gene_type:complete